MLISFRGSKFRIHVGHHTHASFVLSCFGVPCLGAFGCRLALSLACLSLKGLFDIFLCYGRPYGFIDFGESPWQSLKELTSHGLWSRVAELDDAVCA